MDRPTDRLTDGQTDRQTDWLMDRQTDTHTHRPTDRHTDRRQTDHRPTDRPTDWLTDWLADWPTDWLTDRPTDWLTDWLTDRPTVWYVVNKASETNVSWHKRGKITVKCWIGVLWESDRVASRFLKTNMEEFVILLKWNLTDSITYRNSSLYKIKALSKQTRN